MSRAKLDVALVNQGGFATFVRLAWPHYDASSVYVEARHVIVVCGELQKTFRAPTRTFIFNIPPGHTKSSLLSLYQVWVWTEDPAHKFYFGSYSGSELGKREAGKIVALVNSAWFQERWPQVRFVDRKHKAESDPGVKVLHTSGGGMRFAGTPKTGATGEHFDTHIYDDMHKAADPRIEEVADHLGNTMKTRWRGGRHTIIAGMQRICTGDTTDVLIAQGEADLLVLPLEADPAIATEQDWRTEEGEILDPKRYSPEAVARLKRGMPASVIAAQLQQDPRSLGGKVWLSKEWLKICHHLPPKMDRIIDSWDLSQKGSSKSKKGPDKVAGQRWGRLGPDVYLMRRVPTITRGYEAQVKAIRAFLEVDPDTVPDSVIVEDKANGPAVMDNLKKDIQGVIAYNPQGSKEERGELAASYGEAGNVYIVASEHEDMVSLATAFPYMTFDDDMDAMHQAILYLLGRPRGFREVVSDDEDMSDVQELADRLLGGYENAGVYDDDLD